ncbi:NusB family protein [Streptomyces lydicamycinicus]|uniref:NusB family protein n=1 Tax=Streptomyces lydicamycinicus TaxID=1546107 RepID=A0A0P4R3E9_9ACTN|nr:NusB family protein [Streptomyces lydicamycinicus]
MSSFLGSEVQTAARPHSGARSDATTRRRASNAGPLANGAQRLPDEPRQRKLLKIAMPEKLATRAAHPHVGIAALAPGTGPAPRPPLHDTGPRSVTWGGCVLGRGGGRVW